MFATKDYLILNSTLRYKGASRLKRSCRVHHFTVLDDEVDCELPMTLQQSNLCVMNLHFHYFSFMDYKSHFHSTCLFY